jgi:hypothetical protein
MRLWCQIRQGEIRPRLNLVPAQFGAGQADPEIFQLPKENDFTRDRIV